MPRVTVRCSVSGCSKLGISLFWDAAGESLMFGYVWLKGGHEYTPSFFSSLLTIPTMGTAPWWAYGI